MMMRCFLAIHSMIFFERSQVTYANVSKWSILQYNRHKFYSTPWKNFLIRRSHNPLSHNMCLVPHEILSPIVVSLNQGILNPFWTNIMHVSLYTVISKQASLRESHLKAATKARRIKDPFNQHKLVQSLSDKEDENWFDTIHWTHYENIFCWGYYTK